MSGMTIDLEAGIPWYRRRVSMSGMKNELETGIPWYRRATEVRTLHRFVWGSVSYLSYIYSFYFAGDIFNFLRRKGVIPRPQDCAPCVVIVMTGFALLFSSYLIFLIVLTCYRLPGPYKLRRSGKQIIDCTIVVVCSCWTLCFRDQVNTTILGLMLCFHVIPVLNIWWDYQNFGFCDCVLIVLIESALFSCRNNLVLFMAVVILCVALQLLKSVYQEHHVKSRAEK